MVDQLILKVEESSDLAIEEKLLVLGSASILKSSLMYWEAVAANPHHPYYNYKFNSNTRCQTNTLFPLTPQQYTAIVDAAGYVSGYNQYYSGVDASCKADPSCNADAMDKAKYVYGIPAAIEASYAQ